MSMRQTDSDTLCPGCFFDKGGANPCRRYGYDETERRSPLALPGEMFRYGLEQFLAEARTLARLDHPNIVRVRHFFEANDTDYLDRQGGKLVEDAAEQLMLPVLDGLRAVHAQGFLHRDLKPQNIYLARTEGGGARPPPAGLRHRPPGGGRAQLLHVRDRHRRPRTSNTTAKAGRTPGPTSMRPQPCSTAW